MKHSRLMFWLVAIIVLGPSFAGAQEQGYPFRLSNFKIEFYGGYAPLIPEHFNTLADYEESYLQFYYGQRYASLGPGYTVTTERTGDDRFRPLTKAVLWGGRIHYQLSPTLSLSFGVQYMKGSQDSRVGMNVTVLDGGSSFLTDKYENTGFGLSATALLPQLGAHFGWDLTPFFRPGIFIIFGPMFVESRAVSNRHMMKAGPAGYTSDVVETYEMKGRKTSLTGELGGSLHIRLAKFLDFFTDGSYIFRGTPNLSGPGSSRTVIKDSVSGESSTSSNWEGQWNLAPYDTTTSWGRFKGTVANNAYEWSWGFKRFDFDLSGFQLKAGIAIRL
ncbi:MAG: hypothetical protein NTV82_00505 [Candidatus Aminicenantes bacterium]|jgi:hypothetical protein|nr:hypothetical protein [Candidatus Aminicenantes bacterium]